MRILWSGCQWGEVVRSEGSRLGSQLRAGPLGALGEKLDGLAGLTVLQSAVAGPPQV
jgi:hypothetical protein